MRPLHLLLALFFGSLPGPATLFAQGSLTPLGAPAVTMKTLDQVRPGTAIGTLPFTISAPGHYYVTANLATTGSGITIAADDVTLDLNGFTLSGDGDTGDLGIATSGTARARIRIRGGTVRNFAVGIFLAASAAQIVVEDLSVSACTSNGIQVVSNATGGVTQSVFRRLRLVGNASGLVLANAAFTGTGQNLVDGCEALNCTSIGFSISTPGNFVMRCLASGNGTNYSIVPNNRFGVIVAPAGNASLVSGTSGGAGTGATDPFANVSF